MYASIATDPVMLLRWACGSVARPSAHGHFASATIVQALICMASFGAALASLEPDPSAFAVASGRLKMDASSVVAVRVASVDSTVRLQVNASIATEPLMLLPWT